jgi:hypothetical protein
MPFDNMVDHNELVSFVKDLNLPYNPLHLSIEQFAQMGNQHLDAIYHQIGHLMPYCPVAEEALSLPLPLASDPKPIYPAYSNKFTTSEQAKAHRKRGRHDEHGRLPKKATDVERVKKHGRSYWVKRLYESMIDISDIVDTDNSIHRQRFADPKIAGFDPEDLEAAAHHIFDACLRVHERGWCRPVAYHKNVKRGSLKDVAHDSIERRLAQVCQILRESKAAVDDAIRGGVTLALLVDNPTARSATKLSNNNGNKNRGKRLKLAKKAKAILDEAKATKKAEVAVAELEVAEGSSVEDGSSVASSPRLPGTPPTSSPARHPATPPIAPSVSRSAAGLSGVASGRVAKARAGRSLKTKQQK